MAKPRSSTSKPHRSSAAPDLLIKGDSVILQPGLDELVPLFTFASSNGSTSNTPTDPNQQQAPERNLVEHMVRFRESPYEFLRDLSLYVSGTGWRSYDDVIGQPAFYEGFSEDMKRAVMASPMLQGKIQALARGRLDVENNMGLFGTAGTIEYEKRSARRKVELETSLKEVAEGLTDDMICKMESKTFIRSAYYIATQLLTRAYHLGIHVSSSEVLRLRAVAEKAAQQKRSIIFLPNHRSHVDYVSLQLVCYRLGLQLPTVVAGDNLNFPVLGPFLQHAGAMWIRRTFGDDQLYTTLVQSYIDTLFQRGYNFECFIEGSRSRIGKLLPPKFGILSFLLDSVLSGRVEDAIICPVSTQYDKVIEVDSYISELLGTPKPKENLYDFLSASSVLSLKLGRVDVRFHEPWSLRGFIDAQQTRLDSLTMEQQTRLQNQYDRDLRIRLLRTLGYKILSDINVASVVMPTSLIGTVLLTLRGRGVGKAELIRRVDWLSERVKAQGGRVAHFAGLPTKTVVERGLEVLGPKLVGVEKNLVEETYYAVDRFQLSFYRNMTIHLFISQSILCASIYPMLKSSGSRETQAISYGTILTQVTFLSQLFRGEFIFPTAGLTANLGETLAGLESDKVITVKRRSAGSQTATHKQNQISDDIESVALSPIEYELGRENFDFYCFLIWPFIEAAWLSAISLFILTPRPSISPTTMQNTSSLLSQEPSSSTVTIPLRILLARAQLLGKTLYAQGELTYLEAISKETIKNSVMRYEEEGILVITKPSKDSSTGVEPMVRLAAEWMPLQQQGGAVDPAKGKVDVDVKRCRIATQGRLWDFCEEISRSRLEGKNRRDGEASTWRVLELVEQLRDGLEDAAAASASSGAPTVKTGEGVGNEEVASGRLGIEEKEKRIEERRRKGKMSRVSRDKTRANL